MIRIRLLLLISLTQPLWALTLNADRTARETGQSIGCIIIFSLRLCLPSDIAVVSEPKPELEPFVAPGNPTLDASVGRRGLVGEYVFARGRSNISKTRILS